MNDDVLNYEKLGERWFKKFQGTIFTRVQAVNKFVPSALYFVDETSVLLHEFSEILVTKLNKNKTSFAHVIFQYFFAFVKARVK